MKYFTSFVLSAVLCAIPASAQTFAGSDNFDTGSTAKWDWVYRLNGATQGSLSFTNTRLDFSKAAGLGNQFRLWDSDANPAPNVNPLSFTTSWTMSLVTTNTLTVGAGEFASIGIQVFNDDNSYTTLMLLANELGSSVFTETSGSTFTSQRVATADVFDVTLQLAWDATAQTLAASFTTDGTTFTPVATWLPTTQWAGTTTPNGFNFGIFGNSNMAAAISVGSVMADNFSITAASAIPEPSTYAAMAGAIALGLAFWRKRSQINA